MLISFKILQHANWWTVITIGAFKWQHSLAPYQQDLPEIELAFTVRSCVITHLETCHQALMRQVMEPEYLIGASHETPAMNVTAQINNGYAYEIWVIHIFLFCAEVHTWFVFSLAQLHNYKCWASFVDLYALPCRKHNKLEIINQLWHPKLESF